MALYLLPTLMYENAQRVLATSSQMVSSQIVSSQIASSQDVNWREVVLLLPVLGGAISTIHLVIHGLIVIFKETPKPKALVRDVQVDINQSLYPDFHSTGTPWSYMDEVGGRRVFYFKILRAVFSSLLLIIVGIGQTFGGSSGRTRIIGSKNIDIVEKGGMFTLYVRFQILCLRFDAI